MFDIDAVPREEGVVSGFVVDAITGKCVLVQNIAHQDPLFKLPGGRTEQGETIRKTLMREVFEETGLAPICAEFLLKYNARHHPFYVCLAIVGNLDDLHDHSVADGDELIEAKAFDLKEVTRVNMIGAHRTMWQVAREKLEAMNRAAQAARTAS